MEQIIQVIYHDIDVSKFVTTRINPDYLCKDNLVFELLSIGEVEDVSTWDVSNLRSGYRNLVNNTMINYVNLMKGINDINESFSVLDKDIPLLIKFITEFPNENDKEVTKKNVSKAETRFLHYLNRTKQIIDFFRSYGNDENVSESNDKEVRNNEVEQNTDPNSTKLEMGRYVVSLTTLSETMLGIYQSILNLQKLMRVPTPKVGTTRIVSPTRFHTTSAFSIFVPNSETTSSQIDKISNPIPSCSGINSSLTNQTLALGTLSQSQQVDRSHAPCSSNFVVTNSQREQTQHRPTISNFAHAVESSMYNKLRNPIESLLNDLKPCDGLNIDHLLHFISTALKIKSLGPISDMNLLQILSPYTVGALSDKITHSLHNNSNFNDFHSDLLNYFIPHRLLQNIKRDRFYRLQAPGELLSSYIVSIKEVAKLLLLTETEIEIVNTICSGINSAERSRLTFMEKPTTFQQLNTLCIHSQNIAFCDNERNRLYSNSQNRSVVNSLNHSHNSRYGNRNFQHRSNVICNFCKKGGHIERNCYSKLNQNQKNWQRPASKDKT